MATAEDYGKKLLGEVEVVGFDEVGRCVTCFDVDIAILMMVADTTITSTTEWRSECAILQLSAAGSAGPDSSRSQEATAIQTNPHASNRRIDVTCAWRR